jgi:uncharacterized protein (DUF934 family)
MALLRDGLILDADEWVFPGPDEPVPQDRPAALGRDAWLASRERLAGRRERLGLALDPGQAIAPILADLPRLSLVALRIAKFSDGRAYSLARRLRDAHGYRGELRARGDILLDQVKLLLRAGFDTLEIVHPPTLAALRAGRLPAPTRHYQPAAAGPEAAGAERSDTRFPWRRLSRPPAPAGADRG